ncbi:MAG: AAA family ATPase [Chryseolinea sp.]
MKAVLITGMSGTGKSTLLTELSRRGYRAIDTDYNGWCILSSDGSELVWDEEKLTALLSGSENQNLIVSGCVSNQHVFYHYFMTIVLLSAPTNVIMGRIGSRDTNQFGKTPAERARILTDIAEVEPRLRRSADIELDTRIPVSRLADIVEKLFDNE